jgi:hypothetical protein
MSQDNKRPKCEPTRPYKYLEPYGKHDWCIFYGREEEIELLLSDVIVHRLVVLFAETGTGKTSLINAGIRPLLHDLGYRTAYLRVEGDPVYAATETLDEEELLRPGSKALLSAGGKAQLSAGGRGREWYQQIKPPEPHAEDGTTDELVLFFDQFEEFFIQIEDRDRRRTFVEHIAAIYRDFAWIHVVFSMREEYWHEMDEFREEIPSIFGKGSSLRLRVFDREHARDAIVEPAKRFGVTICEDLVKALLDDLMSEEGISPRELQIVCDTLWQKWSEDTEQRKICLGHYDTLGRKRKILEDRLRDDLSRLDAAHLPLFEWLLDEKKLSTGEGTKLAKAILELKDELVRDRKDAPELPPPGALDGLVEDLRGLGLIKENMHGEIAYIEWTSDYLAARTSELQEYARALSLQHLLSDAMSRADELARKRASSDAARSEFAPERIRQVLYMSDGDFQAISDGADLLTALTAAEAEFLFEAALYHGSHVPTWFQQDALDPAKARRSLEDKVTNRGAPPEQRTNTFRFLAQLGTTEAWELLERGLQEPLATTVIDILGEVKTEKAMDLLETALQQEDLAQPVLDELGKMMTREAVELLESALQRGRLASRAAQELDRIAVSGSGQVADLARGALDKWRQRPTVEPRRERPPRPAVEVEPERAIRTGLDKAYWDELLYLIEAGRCTPFIGAGGSDGAMPLGPDLASRWAEEYEYPLEDKTDLARVAQYLAIEVGEMFAKDLLLQQVQDVPRPDFSQPDEPHAALADLDLPIYITTSGDPFMAEALARGGKEVQREFPRWNRHLDFMAQETVFDRGYEPTPDVPLVYHLYGHTEYVESMVLTEADHWDFMVRLTRDPDLLPPAIRTALAGTALIFVGYSLADWSFRMLLRGLAASLGASLGYTGVAVLLPHGGRSPAEQERAQAYMDRYFNSIEKLSTRIYWGTARQFARELRSRWEAPREQS